jgi:hypothetical protein
MVRDRALLERRAKAGPGSESDPIQNVVSKPRPLKLRLGFPIFEHDQVDLIAGPVSRHLQQIHDTTLLARQSAGC